MNNDNVRAAFARWMVKDGKWPMKAQTPGATAEYMESYAAWEVWLAAVEWALGRPK